MMIRLLVVSGGLIATVIGASIPLEAAAESAGGDLTHDWTYISTNPRQRTIRGVITTIKFNSHGNPWDDHDLNMYVKPSEADRYLLRNRAGKANKKCPDNSKRAGEIELEIHTVESAIILDRFKPGMNVFAKGPWVEDSGHCINFTAEDDNTEIHPVRYMISSNEADPLSASYFHLYIGQDNSGRFNIAEDTYIQNLRVQIPTALEEVRVDQEHGRTRHVGALEERSVLDYMTDGGRSQQAAYHRQYPDDAYVQLYTTLPPAPQGFLFPFYLGDFHRHELYQLYSDTITYGSVMVGPQKAIEVTINAELAQMLGMTYHKSQWVVDGHAADELETALKTSTPHTVAITRRYAPAIGATRNAWKLSVATTDRSSTYLPPTAVSTSGFGERRFAHKEVLYRVEPSSIKIIEPFAASGPTTSPSGIPMTKAFNCGSYRLYEAKDTLLRLVQLNPNSLKWYVTRTRDRAGVGVVGRGVVPMGYEYNFTENEVVPGSPFVLPELTATVDPANRAALALQWKNDDDPLNNAVVRVRVAASTDIGEELGDAITAGGRCIPPEYDFRRWMRNIIRAEIAIERLTQLGLLDKFPSRWPPVPVRGLIEQQDVWIKQLKGQPRVYAEFLAKYISGKPMDKSNEKTLMAIVELGEKLSWDKDPPNAQLEAMLRAGAIRVFGYRPVDARKKQRTVDVDHLEVK